jgi:hypothetical protein
LLPFVITDEELKYSLSSFLASLLAENPGLEILLNSSTLGYIYHHMKNKIIEEAYSWIDTRFKHQGRLKKSGYHYGGCDCLGLIIGIAKDLDLRSLNGKKLESLDNITYPKLLTSNILQEKLNQFLARIAINDLEIGDIILIEINNWPQHLAIISALKPNISIIHSYAQARKVVEQHLPEEWFKKIIAAYRLNE